MLCVPHPDKTPGQIITHKDQVASSHETEGLTRKFGTSQDDTITRKLDSTFSTSIMHSSKDALSTLPAAPSRTVFPFFRLPRELRDEIYIYASMTERVWIGRPPRLDHTLDDVIIEENSIYEPATLIRTDHSIISVCHGTRDEIRTATWRGMMFEHRLVHLRVHDFAFGPLEELFANCSASEVEELQERDKCRVQHHITSAFYKYRRSVFAHWEIVDVLKAWLMFETRGAPLDAEQFIEECDWYDARLLRTALLTDNVTHALGQDTRWRCPEFLELWHAVAEAYEIPSEARIVDRNAFHKLAPLGR